MSVTMLNLSNESESNGSNLAKSKNEHKQTNRQINLAIGSLIGLLIAAKYFGKQLISN